MLYPAGRLVGQFTLMTAAVLFCSGWACHMDASIPHAVMMVHVASFVKSKSSKVCR